MSLLPYITEDQIKGIKSQMEAQHSAKLSRTTTFSQTLNCHVIKLVCKNNIDRMVRCPFLIEFYQHEKGYLMKNQNLHHLVLCTLNSEEAYFAKNKLVLDSHRENIVQIMKDSPQMKPKEILDFLIMKYNLNPKFLTNGLEGDRHFERRMKKKFDNTILELRHELNIVIPKDSKEKSKTKNGHSVNRVVRAHDKDESFVVHLPKPQIPSFTIECSEDEFKERPQPSFYPVIELIDDQPENCMRIHLVNRSKERAFFQSDFQSMESGRLRERRSSFLAWRNLDKSH